MALDKTFFEDLEARIPKGKVRTRFAPSPTGYMHVGIPITSKSTLEKLLVLSKFL